MNPKKTTPIKPFVPFVTIVTPESTTVLNKEGAFAFGILSNAAFPHFKFIKDDAWLNQSPFSKEGTGPKCLYQRPYAWVKCTVCKKKNCGQACQGCGSAYCTEGCWMIDMFSHARKCGSFWCMLDMFQKQEGAVNNIKCPPPIHNHICHYCYRVKTPAVIKCEKCQRVQYCSMQCREADLKEIHAKLCAAYQKDSTEEKQEDCGAMDSEDLALQYMRQNDILNAAVDAIAVDLLGEMGKQMETDEMPDLIDNVTGLVMRDEEEEKIGCDHAQCKDSGICLLEEEEEEESSSSEEEENVETRGSW